MVHINREGWIVRANRQSERLFGFTQEEMLGQPVEMLIPVRHRERHPEQVAGVFRLIGRPTDGGGHPFSGATQGRPGVPRGDRPQSNHHGNRQADCRLPVSRVRLRTSNIRVNRKGQRLLSAKPRQKPPRPFTGAVMRSPAASPEGGPPRIKRALPCTECAGRNGKGRRAILSPGQNALH